MKKGMSPVMIVGIIVAVIIVGIVASLVFDNSAIGNFFWKSKTTTTIVETQTPSTNPPTTGTGIITTTSTCNIATTAPGQVSPCAAYVACIVRTTYSQCISDMNGDNKPDCQVIQANPLECNNL